MKYLILSLLLFFASQAQAWVIESDFESGTIGQKADGPSGLTAARALTLYSNERAHTGKQSAKATIQKGDVGWKQWGGRYGYPTLTQNDEIWMRVWMYFPNDWVFSSGPKQLRIHSKDSGGGNEGYFDIFFLKDQMKMNSEVGAALPPNCSESGSLWRCNQGPASPHKVDVNMNALRGQWIAVEMYVKFHATAGKGIYRTWLNGKLMFEDLKTPTMKSSTSQSDLIYIHTIWNNGAPVTQSDYLDDIIVTNETPSNKDSKGNSYIGTDGATFKAKPNPPAVSTK